MDVASALERYMLSLINAERAARGLDALQLEQNLNTSADIHSRWMTDTDTFSHTGAGGSSHTDRIRAAEFDLAGSWRTAENIAAVSISGWHSLHDEVDRMHANLMNSPTHRANILDPNVDYIGIGIVTGPMTYGSGNTLQSLLVTQNFAATSRGVVDLDLGGGAGADRLVGGRGDDHLSGGAGDDVLLTGSGNDRVLAGDGNDRVEAWMGVGVKEIDGGTGIDTLALALDRGDVSFAMDAERLVVTTSNGALTLNDMEWIDFADGTVSVDALINELNRPARSVRNGSDGDDNLSGTAGTDLLSGAGGADTLDGGEGLDVLVAEARGLFGTEESGQVFRLYSAVFGREPDAGGHQSFTRMLASDGLTLAELAAGFVDSPEFLNRYGAASDTQFVTLLYNNVFARAPDGAGLQAWVTALQNGMSRAEAVLGFSESTEHLNRTAAALDHYEQTTDPVAWVDDVYRVFNAIFDREPTASSLDMWVGLLSDGAADFDALVASFANSAEFQARYAGTDDAGFVTRVFETVLDRPPAQAGVDYWTAMLEDGMSRAKLVQLFANTAEFVTKTDAALTTFMRGQGGDDVLVAGAGDSRLSGGQGVDAFVFDESHDGTHEITDLEAWDVLELSGFGYGDVSEALANFRQEGDDVIFEDQGVTLVLNDWQLSQITEDMLDIA